MNFTEKLNLLTAQSQSQIEKSKKVQAMLAGSLAQQDYVKFLVVLYPVVSSTKCNTV
jgi:heme oxygenase